MKQKFKNEKGITLVALVITIIVLLILAGVTLSMVMGDSGIFGKANSAKEKTKLSNAEEIIKLAVLENKVNKASGDTALSDDELKAEITKKLTEQGYTVDGSNVNYDGDKAIDIEDYLDKENSSDTYSVGDKVTVGGEGFYVLKNNEDKLTLLAEKNLDTTNLQQSDNADNIKFSSTNYWTSLDTEIKYPYNINSLDTSSDTDVIAIARDYGRKKGGEGRLMTLDEVVELGGNADSYVTAKCPEWINKGTYWLGTACRTMSVWEVIGEGGAFGNDSYEGNRYGVGVRPVIEISKSQIK